MLVFMKKRFLVDNFSWRSLTWIRLGSDTMVYAENKHTSPRSDERSTPKGWIRGNAKIGPVLEVNGYVSIWNWNKNWCMKNDGSQSWIAISRAMNKLPQETAKSIHYEEVTAVTGRPVATIHSVIISTLNDCCANRSADVERHSCRW